MPKRRRILIPLVVVLLVLAWVVFGSGAGDGPVYEGRRLSRWVEILGRAYAIRKTDPEADLAIQNIGTNAFPYLLQWIQSETTPARFRLPSSVRRYVSRHPTLEAALIPASELRLLGSIHSFDLLRSNTPAFVVDELVRLMNAPQMQTANRATRVLARVGPTGIPPLVAVLESPSHHMRRAVVLAAVRMEDPGPAAEKLVPGLIESLKDDGNIGVAPEAAMGIGKFKVLPRLSVPALARVLGVADPRLRCSAAWALGEFSADAAEAIPALTALRNDPDSNVRSAAESALLKITN
jgi:hypothetical protein